MNKSGVCTVFEIQIIAVTTQRVVTINSNCSSYLWNPQRFNGYQTPIETEKEAA